MKIIDTTALMVQFIIEKNGWWEEYEEYKEQEINKIDDEGVIVHKTYG